MFTKTLITDNPAINDPPILTDLVNEPVTSQVQDTIASPQSNLILRWILILVLTYFYVGIFISIIINHSWLTLFIVLGLSEIIIGSYVLFIIYIIEKT
jgi:hypothetical protein